MGKRYTLLFGFLVSLSTASVCAGGFEELESNYAGTKRVRFVRSVSKVEHRMGDHVLFSCPVGGFMGDWDKVREAQGRTFMTLVDFKVAENLTFPSQFELPVSRLDTSFSLQVAQTGPKFYTDGDLIKHGNEVVGYIHHKTDKTKEIEALNKAAFLYIPVAMISMFFLALPDFPQDPEPEAFAKARWLNDQEGYCVTFLDYDNDLSVAGLLHVMGLYNWGQGSKYYMDQNLEKDLSSRIDEIYAIRKKRERERKELSEYISKESKWQVVMNRLERELKAGTESYSWYNLLRVRETCVENEFYKKRMGQLDRHRRKVENWIDSLGADIKEKDLKLFEDMLRLVMKKKVQIAAEVLPRGPVTAGGAVQGTVLEQQGIPYTSAGYVEPSAELQKARTQVVQKDRELAQKDRELVQKGRELDNVKTERDAAVRREVEVTTERDAAIRREIEAKRERDAAIQREIEAKKERDLLKLELAKAERKIAEAERKIAEAEGKIDEIIAREAATAAKLALAKEELDLARKERDLLNRKLADFEGKINRLLAHCGIQDASTPPEAGPENERAGQSDAEGH